ncbi:transposase [Prevotella pectinovora]|uniref:transposase n=1 Tax=Prevotella pectinovora TaxID=1602169 RepID=UPI0009E1A8A8|nr:transposase [Prevotella pectinovora]
MDSYSAECRQGARHRRNIPIGRAIHYHSQQGCHGRKGAIIAVVKGTNPADVLKVLMQLPADKREMVGNITMDLSDCMRAIVREAFPKATVVRDCFHVVKCGGEGCEDKCFS